MSNHISSIKEALLLLEGQDPSTEQFTEVAAAIHNAIQLYHVISDKRKRATPQTSLDHFFKRVDRIESNKKSEVVPLKSGVSEMAACPPGPTVDDFQVYYLPHLLPSSHQ